MNAAYNDLTDPDEYDYAAARAALLERFDAVAAHLNHAAPRSSWVDSHDPDALTLRVGQRAYFTFHRTANGIAYAWWYPASRQPIGDHTVVGDPVPVVRAALLSYMRRARSELG